MPTYIDELDDEEVFKIFKVSLDKIALKLGHGAYASTAKILNTHLISKDDSSPSRDEIEKRLKGPDAPNFIIRYSRGLPGWVISHQQDDKYLHSPLKSFIMKYDFVSNYDGFQRRTRKVELLYKTVNESIKASQPREEVVIIPEAKLTLLAKLFKQAIREQYRNLPNAIKDELAGDDAERILRSNDSMSYLLRFSGRSKKHVISYKNGSNIEHVNIDEFVKDRTILDSKNPDAIQLYKKIHELLIAHEKEFMSFDISVEPLNFLGEDKKVCNFLVNGQKHAIFHEDAPLSLFGADSRQIGSHYGDEKLFHSIINKREFIGVDDASGALVYLEQHPECQYAIYFSKSYADFIICYRDEDQSYFVSVYRATHDPQLRQDLWKSFQEIAADINRYSQTSSSVSAAAAAAAAGTLTSVSVASSSNASPAVDDASSVSSRSSSDTSTSSSSRSSSNASTASSSDSGSDASIDDFDSDSDNDSASMPAKGKKTAAPSLVSSSMFQAASRVFTMLNDVAFQDVIVRTLKAEKNMNPKDENGQTPLMLAAIKGNVGLVRELLDNGADPLIKDHNEKTAYDLANTKSNRAILKLLSDKMIKPTDSDQDAGGVYRV